MKNSLDTDLENIRLWDIDQRALCVRWCLTMNKTCLYYTSRLRFWLFLFLFSFLFAAGIKLLASHISFYTHKRNKNNFHSFSITSYCMPVSHLITWPIPHSIDVLRNYIYHTQLITRLVKTKRPKSITMNWQKMRKATNSK